MTPKSPITYAPDTHEIMRAIKLSKDILSTDLDRTSFASFLERTINETAITTDAICAELDITERNLTLMLSAMPLQNANTTMDYLHLAISLQGLIADRLSELGADDNDIRSLMSAAIA